MKLENFVKGITVEITTDELKELNTIATYFTYKDTVMQSVVLKLLGTIDKFLSNTNG